MAVPWPLFATALETVLNGYMRLDPEAVAAASELAGLHGGGLRGGGLRGGGLRGGGLRGGGLRGGGKTFHIDVSGWDIHFYLQIQAAGVRVRSQPEGPVAVSVRATPAVLLRLARGVDGAEREAIIEGDMSSARALQRWLKSIDVDWEEQLAKLIGDIPAHQLGRLARAGAAWGRHAGAKLQLDLGEYLLYERRDLPPRTEVERFLNDVDTLRSDLDRLEARIQRLQRAHRVAL